MSTKTRIFLRAPSGRFVNYDSSTGKVTVDTKARTWESTAYMMRHMEHLNNKGELPPEAKERLTILKLWNMTAEEIGAAMHGNPAKD